MRFPLVLDRKEGRVKIDSSRPSPPNNGGLPLGMNNSEEYNLDSLI
jgi:hypothetical protein